MAHTHASKSPSGAERFHACPGSLPFTRSLPASMRRGSTQASRLGTAAHFLLEKSLQEMKHPSTFEGRIIELLPPHEDGSMLRVGAKLPTDPSRVWFIVDEDMVEGVSIAYDYVLARVEQLGLTMADVLLESRTNPLPDRDDTSGTADVTIDAWPILLEVVDYKNGYMLVEHKDNPQLLAYLTGRAEDTGWSHDAYAITVVQPNAYHEEGKRRRFELTADELRAFQAKHRAAVERVDAAEAEWPGLSSKGINDDGSWAKRHLVAGEHCKMCDAALICPAKKAFMKAQAGVDFDSEVPTEGLVPLDGLEDAAKVLAWASIIQDHISQASKLVNAALRSGQKVLGMKLIRGKSNRVWDSPEKVQQRLVEAGVLKPDMGPRTIAQLMADAKYIGHNEQARLYTEPKLISGPQAEKLVASKQRKEFSSLFLHKPPGALRVVPEDAPGEPVTLNPADDFDDYQEDE